MAITTGDIVRLFPNLSYPAVSDSLVRWRKEGWIKAKPGPTGQGHALEWEPWVPRMAKFLMNEGLPTAGTDNRRNIYLHVATYLQIDEAIEWFVASDGDVAIAFSLEQALASIADSSANTVQVIHLPQ